MQRLIYVLALLLGLILLAAAPASPAWLSGQKVASGSVAVVELLALENALLSAERSGENPTLSYESVSGSPVAARGTRSVVDALKGLRAGRSSGVKVVDSADELNGLFGRLSSGGKAVEGSTYPGRLVKLPDGTTIGLRTGSKSGGPTIDIKFPDGTLQKIHVQP